MPRPSKYEFVDSSELPEDVFDELCDNEVIAGNDSGTIVNPKYHPSFKQWLEQNGYEVKPYILWASW